MNPTIAQLTSPQAINYENLMAFMREQATHVSIDLLIAFNDWVEQGRVAGVSIDEDLVTTVQHDLHVHHRLTAETLVNAPHAPYISLDHTEDQHFGRE